MWLLIFLENEKQNTYMLANYQTNISILWHFNDNIWRRRYDAIFYLRILAVLGISEEN